MLGGYSNGNPGFPAFAEESRLQYDMSALPQLQLFGDFPVGCTVDPINYVGNEHATASSRPMKRAREPELISTQQQLHISLKSNFCHDDAGQNGSILNPNPVSTGLRLSYEEDERNSSVTSASENMKAINRVACSVSTSVKIEMDRQKDILDSYIRVQQENIIKGVRALNQRHTTSFLNVLEKRVGRKLQEKEVEIENMNRKNKELGEKIKQVAMEAQSWHYRAKHNESVVNVLKANLQQAIAQGAGQAREGYGDSEVDDAASYINQNPSENLAYTKRLNCRACNEKEVCVLLLPCRHLCLCKDCEGFVDICPVCRVMKNASVDVFFS